MKSQVIESINIAQAKSIIAQTADIYFSRDQRGHYRVERRRARPVCLMGPAGVGKTEIVRQVAEEKGLAFLSYSVTHHTRQSIIGLPKLAEGVIEGRTVSMTEYTMSEIIAAVYKTMAETGRNEGILFLDEFNCASESLRPIMMQLLQDKAFGPHAIPDGWMLVLAGNPPEYNRAATDLDAVTADRMRLVHIEPDYPAWRSYAKKRGVHPVIISYLDNHQENFYLCQREQSGTALVTARGWEDLSIMMTCLENAGQEIDLPLVSQYVQAAKAARGFFSYHLQYAAVINSGILDQVLAGSPKAGPAIRAMDDQRSWALVAALLRRVISMSVAAKGLDDTTSAAHGCLKQLGQELAEGKLPPANLSSELIRRAEALEDRPAREFLQQCAKLPGINEKEGWQTVRQMFAEKVRAPRMEAYKKTGTAISRVIAVCRKALANKPHLEFLFNSFADSPELLYVIACDDFPEFKGLLQDISFDVQSESKALLDELEGTA